MERAELLRRLEQVEQEVSQTLELITRHRNILAEFGGKEVDGETIEIMLTQLEHQLVFQFRERERLRAELAQLNGRGTMATMFSESVAGGHAAACFPSAHSARLSHVNAKSTTFALASGVAMD